MRIASRSALRLRVTGTDLHVSGTVRPRLLLVAGALVAAAVLAFCLELTTGDIGIAPADVLVALSGSADAATTFVVLELRLPRALVGALAGMAFGVSGALFQSMTRNPLASPDIIGVTQGASLAAVAGLVGGAGSGLGIPLTALLGGVVAAAALYVLAWRRGTTGYRIVLVGIGIAGVCASLTNYLLMKADIYQAQQALFWLVGNLSGRDTTHIRPVLIGVAVLVPLVIGLHRWLVALVLGDDTARGLGVPVQLARLAVVFAGVGLVAVATSAAGPVAFVALIAPQVAARLARLPSPPPLTSGLVGLLMVLACDLVARHAMPGTELPVGVVTGVVGGPFLLWLLARVNRTGSGG